MTPRRTAAIFRLAPLLLAATLVAAAVPLAAEERPSLAQRQKVAPTPFPFVGGSFGRSVDISGDWAAVGAPDDDGAVEDSGAVHVYEFVPVGQWSRVAHLFVADGASSDWFGHALALDGDTLLVGAPLRDDPQQSGIAYLFERDAGDEWNLAAELRAPEPMEHDNFGRSVALEGDTAVIGAREFGDERAGSAYVFRRDPLDPTVWSLVARLSADDGDAGDEFGFSVALDGAEGEIVVGAVADEELGEAAGSAYVFRRDPLDPDAWLQAAKLTASDGAPEDAFGTAVAIHRGLVVVGADQYDPRGTGAVYTFARDRSDPWRWSEISKLVPADGEERDAFGDSVALRGDALVVGADGRGPGWAYLYRRSTTAPELWRRIAKVKAADSETFHSSDFGISVAISGNFTILVGDWAKSPDGAAYFFRPTLVDPHSLLDGSCPGQVTLATGGLTPDGLGSVYTAPEPGITALGGSPCVGTELDLGTPLSYLTGGQATPDGTDSTLLDVDASDCGHYLQLIDLTSCAVANVVRLPR